MILPLVLGLLKGPLSSVIDAYVSDVELRRKLKAELEAKVIDHLGEAMAAERDVITAEVSSEHWLTRSWRPLLMLLAMAIIAFYGLGLPAIEALAGHAIVFRPRWSDIPPDMWDLLTIGIGGYVGGRSVEKIAGAFAGREDNSTPRLRRWGGRKS
jgi:Holin of 3TMs, for gene-transfer release